MTEEERRKAHKERLRQKFSTPYEPIEEKTRKGSAPIEEDVWETPRRDSFIDYAIEDDDMTPPDWRKNLPSEDIEDTKKQNEAGAGKRKRNVLLLVVVIFIAIGLWYWQSHKEDETVTASGDATVSVAETKAVVDMPEIKVDLIPVNKYSRGAYLLPEVNGIVVHYTGNPGTTAGQNRDYFAGLAQTHEARASSHFIIDLDGEIIQCIPLTEQSYASNDRNEDTIAIECCHIDETGEFTQETYDSLVYLCAYLIGMYDLQPTDIIRHYDVTGKECPRYFVENKDSWETFQADVEEYISLYGKEKETSGS